MQPFRFIHASDLHLERPPRGLAEVPETLRSALVEAPYRAAQRVFDAALKENVDFVVLSGDVVDPRLAGPRGVVFLEEQFCRLAQRGIQVYWAGGRADDFETWLDGWPLPTEVLRFPLAHVERALHFRSGEPIAQILGTSTVLRTRIRASDFRPDDNHVFSIAAAYGLGEANLFAGQPIDYWALGGSHERRTPLSGKVTSHYPGTTQGRRPRESAPGGCTLVSVDEQRRARLSFIATDSVRFHEELVRVADTTNEDQLLALFNERIADLAADPFGPDWLIAWTIGGDLSLERRLRHGKLAADLVAQLRSQHAANRPAIWTISIDAAGSGIAEESYEEQTVLGELLRNVRHFSLHPEEPLGLEPHLVRHQLAGDFHWRPALDQPDVRQRVLAEVSKLGVELLSAEEVAR